MKPSAIVQPLTLADENTIACLKHNVSRVKSVTGAKQLVTETTIKTERRTVEEKQS